MDKSRTHILKSYVVMVLRPSFLVRMVMSQHPPPPRSPQASCGPFVGHFTRFTRGQIHDARRRRGNESQMPLFAPL